jgi:precorrin-6B methylase 2
MAAYIIAILIIVFVISIFLTDFFGAPWVPTPRKLVPKMLTLAEVGPDDVVYDLGCGDGRIIIAAARHYGAKAVGIEIDPLRYLWCQAMVSLFGIRDRVTVVYSNIFTQDLSPATVVTCFLRQRTNNKLEGKLLKELQPGTRVVSNTFIFPTVPAVAGDDVVRLYLFYPDKFQGLKQAIKTEIEK